MISSNCRSNVISEIKQKSICLFHIWRKKFFQYEKYFANDEKDLKVFERFIFITSFVQTKNDLSHNCDNVEISSNYNFHSNEEKKVLFNQYKTFISKQLMQDPKH